ncbi:aliphatic sulfonates ABC transporter substrate-b inding protein [Desulfonema ishimotonii]|uniref:Aliphatic sulfonates ABC transporter substrate-b inding protein n=1 Tax=Desulfonema ishimotonii TaxID=45657 RepID=A0A401FVJ5_9BACT|nr:ABC transporter substrate-binding protein [Desulfonema ishimotonii]GBC60985.1 aliphatic sulfonates ABC transporter substrate-b inding protein [Desulfonema ishimotonii]
MKCINLTGRIILCGLCFFALLPNRGDAEEYKIGTWKTAQTIQPFYYEKFLPETSETSVFPFTNPADQKTALLAGSLNMCGTTLAHAIHSAALGQPVVLVAALCNKCSALVIRNNGPVNSIRDLRGKKIGYVPGTMHEILLRETLLRNQLSPEKDVHLIRVDFFDMGLALARGGIDAFLSGEPFPTLAVSQGYGRILSYPYYGESVGTINAGMLVTRQAIEKTPELVYRLVKAHAEATRYLQAHPDEWLKKASAFGTPLPILRQAAPNMELAWKVDEDFVRKTRALGERMAALGVIRTQPDYDRLFDLTFVKRVARELDKTKDTGSAL